MSLVMLVALGLLSLAVGLAAPMAELELRQGRAGFRGLVVDELAEGGLTDLERGLWTAAAVGVGVGDSLPLPAITPRPALLLTRRMYRVSADLWFGESTATLRDGAGSILASARQGLLIRVGAQPPDTTRRVWAITRPWVTGFQ